MCKESGEEGTGECCRKLWWRSNCVEAKEKETGVVDKEEEYGGEECCNGQDRQEGEAGGGGGEG